MKKFVPILVIVILFSTTVFAQDLRSKRYGGYVVLLNGETFRGIVYKSQHNYSQLIVFYESTNSAFLYPGLSGKQTVVDLDMLMPVLLENFGFIFDSMVAIIQPKQEALDRYSR